MARMLLSVGPSVTRLSTYDGCLAQEEMSSLLSTVFSPVTAAWGFISRNKKLAAAVVVGGVAAGGYYVYKKAKPIIDEVMSQIRAMEALDRQMNASKGLTKQQMLRHRFEHQLSVGDMTVRNFAALTRTDIMTVFDVEALREAMRRKTSSDKRDTNELKAWDDLKVCGFARTVTTLYALALQNLITKIHLTIAARYVLTEETVSQDPTHKRLCEYINRQYFSVLSQHTHTKGLKLLCQHIERACVTVMAKWKLGALCSYDALIGALNEIRSIIEGETQNALIAAATTAASSSSSSSSAAAAGGGGEGGVLSTEHRPRPFLWYVLPTAAELDVVRVDLKQFDESNAAATVPAAPSIQSALSPSSSASSSAAAGAGGGGGSGAVPPPMSESFAAARAQFANIRFAEMIAETRAVLHNESFQLALKASIDAAFDVLTNQIKSGFVKKGTAAASSAASAATAAPTKSSSASGDEPITPLYQPSSSSVTLSAVSGESAPSKQPEPTLAPIPFANVVIQMTKVFGLLLPERSTDVASSPLFELFAHRMPDVTNFCSIVYMPIEPATPEDANTAADTAAAAAAAAAQPAASTAAAAAANPFAMFSADPRGLGGFGGGPGVIGAQQQQFLNSYFGSAAAAAAPPSPATPNFSMGAAAGTQPFNLPIAKPTVGLPSFRSL